MAAQLGSSLYAFKAAFYTALATRVNNPTTGFTLSYAAPTDPVQLLGEAGSGVAAWWDDTVECDVAVTVFKGGDKWFDESYVTTLVIQGLALNTDEDQATIDLRTTHVLGEAIGLLAEDPTAGVVDTSTVEVFHAYPVGWTNRIGNLNLLTAGHYELRVRVDARIKLT